MDINNKKKKINKDKLLAKIDLHHMRTSEEHKTTAKIIDQFMKKR